MAYPNSDIGRAASPVAAAPSSGAPIADVTAGSPADDAGFAPGCLIASVDGEPVRDVIDWRWMSGEESIVVGYIDLDGDAGEVELWREPGEEWGFEFEGLVFDGVKQCRNACTFCFMRQLPPGMRPSLSLRDDDFRLSFLVGTFVTLTNLTPADERRIVEQRISPLRVSLQASDPDVRARLIGKHAQHGIDALDRLLAAGIEFHAQIVLVPGENDGSTLVETLAWAYGRPGILGVGIVPLGYTRHQASFDHSFNDEVASRALLGAIAPFQERALVERGTPWVFAADEFYRNAHRADLVQSIPPANHYGDFSMFEDGIGIIRSTVDDWRRAEGEGLVTRAATALRAAGCTAVLVAGCAQREFLDSLIAESGIADAFAPLYVQNAFFGGNVDVTGLLVAEDIIRAIREHELANAPSGGRPEGDCSHSLNQGEQRLALDVQAAMDEQPSGGTRKGGFERFRSRDGRRAPLPARARTSEQSPSRVPPEGGPEPALQGAGSNLYLIPRVIFNDDLVTLDDKTLQDMEKATGCNLHMVSCSPTDYLNEIIALVAG